MDRFVVSIKRKYRERLLQHEEQWPPVRGNKLIKLRLVEADKTEGFRAGLPQHGAHNDKVKRTPILHDDLFKVEEDKKPVRKLIVEGNAGIGKTTLCTMLTEEWAKGEILTQFDCVLLLPLRERSVSTATTLPQLFKLLHSSERIRTSVIEELEEREGEGVLIIADGWDELDEENRSDSSFLHNLLFGDILPFLSVLLTSRPSASAPLHNLPTVDRLVEVVGFSEENVKQYIESDFEKCPEKASSLIEQLDSNPLIASACSVPLNCAIICNVWQTLDRTLPSTLTELYSLIVLNVILRNFKKRKVVESFITLSFDSIPEHLHEMFWLTCKFAYECLSQDKIVFTKKEIAPLFPQVLDSSDKLLCFGLLQCARSLLPVGQGLSFHFVHLTIQEFLAALHLVTLPSGEKLKVCEAHAESNRFAMVWRFVFGLACQEEGSYSRKVICLDDEVVGRFLSTNSDGLLSHVPLMFCHCSLESMNSTVGLRIAKQINGKFCSTFDLSIANTPHDCVAVFHVVRHTSHCSKMTITLSNCGLTGKLLKQLTDILSNKSSKLQSRELTLYDRMVTDKGIGDLLYRGSSSFSSQELFSSNSITDIISQDLSSSCNNLTFLKLSNNPLGMSGIQSLETAVQAGGLVNLEKLYLSNTLTDDAGINGVLLTTLSPSIASHCPNLKWLDLSSNNLAVPGASALSHGELFANNSSEYAESIIETAIFSLSTFFYNQHSPCLSDNLLHVWCEKTLDLSNTNINAEAVLTFARSRKPSFGFTLNLSYNPLGYDGLLAIFSVISETNRITSLDLSHSDLTTPVNTEYQYHNIQLLNTSSVLNFGPSIEILSVLNLSNNNFSGDRVLILAECVQVCKSLVHLNCQSCSLASKEVIKILDHLKSSGDSHENLREWNLGENSIDDKGVSALTKSVHELFFNLEDVHLYGNPVSAEIEERLQKILEANCKERESREEAEEEKSQAQLEAERSRFAAEKEAKRSTVLTEWERTCSPPQSEEMLQTFQEMWAELLEELVCGILDHPTRESIHSLNHWNLVGCEDVSAGYDPLKLDLTTEGSPAPPSDDESFHSATEELDEQVGPPPTATDESTSSTVQSPHRMDQQETMSNDGTSEMITPPQTTPSPYDTLSGVSRLKTVTIEELKTRTKVTDPQLNTEIKEIDLLSLAVYFNSIETFPVLLGLNPAEQQDVKYAFFLEDMQTAMFLALRLWRKANPGAATYKALVEIVLRMGGNGVPVATEVCKIAASIDASSQGREQSSS